MAAAGGAGGWGGGVGGAGGAGGSEGGRQASENSDGAIRVSSHLGWNLMSCMAATWRKLFRVGGSLEEGTSWPPWPACVAPCFPPSLSSSLLSRDAGACCCCDEWENPPQQAGRDIGVDSRCWWLCCSCSRRFVLRPVSHTRPFALDAASIAGRFFDRSYEVAP